MSASPEIAEAPPGQRRTLTVGDLHEWVAGAKPNARLTYARGSHVREGCSELVRRAVFDLYEKGWLTPHRIAASEGGAPHHIVQRTARPFLKGMKL